MIVSAEPGDDGLMATIGREITEDAMARRMMIPGTTMKDIAEELGLHYNTIRKYARSEHFQDKLAALRRKLDEAVLPDLQARLRHAAARSLQVMNDKLDSQNERVQLKAAADLMDRDPRLSKTRKVRAVDSCPIISADQFALIVQAAREIDGSGAGN